MGNVRLFRGQTFPLVARFAISIQSQAAVCLASSLGGVNLYVSGLNPSATNNWLEGYWYNSLVGY